MQPLPDEAALSALARRWEPALFAARTEAPFDPAGLTPCIGTPAGRRCAPGAFVLGAWQTGTKHLAALLRASHPEALVPLGNGACWGQWKNDEGGRRWLERAVPASLDPSAQLAAALHCHATLQFYPDSAHRFHKWWEESYWPCKKRCTDVPACEKTYYKKEMWTCKAAALRAHDAAVDLPTVPAGGAFNFTTPWLLRSFYGSRPPRLIALLRSPIDRLVHAYYGHPHYGKKYGVGARRFGEYVTEQVAGWRACERRHGLRRCAIHFEQLGPEPAAVFFHADQIIRGMYAPFVEDWLRAMAGALLCLRTEDLLEPATRRAALRHAWMHLGLGVASVDATGLATAEAKLPATRGELGRRREPTEAREPLLAATRAELCALYAPLNRQLRDLLAADRTSCEGVGCDGFLWSEDCTAAEGV